MSAAPVCVVMGVSGSGKSTVGAALARRLGVEYADGDAFHSQDNIAKMSAGQPLDDDDRRTWLRSIATWLADHRDTGGVVSCSALRRSYRAAFVERAPSVAFVHLHGDAEVLRKRVASREHFMPPTLLDSQLATLEPLEPDERGFTLDLSLGVDDLVELVVASPTIT